MNINAHDQDFSNQRAHRSNESNPFQSYQPYIILNVLCLMLAIGPNIAWLYFSRYLETYLYHQMDSYDAKPKVEVWLFFLTTIVTAFFMPFAAIMIRNMHIKAVICLSCICLMTGSLSFIIVNNVWTFIIMQSIFSSIGTSIMLVVALQLAWEWFSPKRRGFINGVVIGFKNCSTALVIFLQVMIIESKNLAPIENLSSNPPANIDVTAQKVAMKMILVYFIMCGLQGIITAVVLATAKRNDVQLVREIEYTKRARMVNAPAKARLIDQVRQSNSVSRLNKTQHINSPGSHYKSAEYLPFRYVLRSKQIMILWCLEFLKSCLVGVFALQVIYSSAQEIDKDHAFCRGNLYATLAVGLCCPLLGLLNDGCGIRYNSAIALIGLACTGATVSYFDTYSDMNKFWYLLVAHLLLSWWEITINYGISHLFGVYSASYALGFVKTAEVLAGLVMLPLVLALPCLD